MSILIGVAGVLYIVIGFGVVISIDFSDEGKFAAIALGLGIAGGFLMCLSNFVGG